FQEFESSKLASNSTAEHDSAPEYASSAHVGRVATTSRVTGEQRGVERWTEALHRDIWSYRQLKRRRWQKPLSLIAVGVIVVIVSSALKGTWSFWNFPFWMVYLLFAGKELRDQSAISRREAAYEVSRIKDPKAVNVLAMATQTDKDTRAVAIGGLVSLLP